MQRKRACTSILVGILTLVLDYSLTYGQPAVIPAERKGWYTETGFNEQQLQPPNYNFAVGDHRGTDCRLDNTCYSDFRNFFVFDLSFIPYTIQSAKLALQVPFSGFASQDVSETYELHDVVTPIASLLDGTGGVAAWSDLGSGIVYGSRSMTAADMGRVIEIDLNSSAIAALNANHGKFGIGGSLTTLDSLPNNEYTFAFTGPTKQRNYD